MIILEAAIGGLLLSLVTGGSLRNFERERLRGEWLFLAMLPLQLLWPRLSQSLGLGCMESVSAWLLMMLSLVVTLALNAGRRRALLVAAIGIMMNVTVIAANGAMPVSLRAVSELGVPRAEALESLDADCLHTQLDEESRLAALADVVAVPGPGWQRGVISLGDLLLAIGLAGWVFMGARNRPV